MVDNGKITQEEADKAAVEVITVTDTYAKPMPVINIHTISMVINEITTKYGISEEDLRTKDIKIYTGLESQNMQADLAETFSPQLVIRKRPTAPSLKRFDCHDPETGDVLATVGDVFQRETQI